MTLELASLIVGAGVFVTVFLRSTEPGEDGNPVPTGNTLTRAIVLTMGAMLAVFAIGLVSGFA